MKDYFDTGVDGVKLNVFTTGKSILLLHDLSQWVRVPLQFVRSWLHAARFDCQEIEDQSLVVHAALNRPMVAKGNVGDSVLALGGGQKP